jgi:membrane protein implicated in regulation of membrane protease activity
MLDFTLNAWHWLGLAATLLLIEVLSGTGFLLCLSISAFGVSVLLWWASMSIVPQLFLFAVFSLIAAIGWKVYLQKKPTQASLLNKRAAQYIGRVFILKTSIINGQGSISVDDSVWQVHCDEALVIGETVQVVGADGVILKVKKA